LIFLHGLGDSSEEFLGVFYKHEGYGITNRYTKIVLPTAPKRKVTCEKNKEETNSWFDIYTIEPEMNAYSSMGEICARFN